MLHTICYKIIGSDFMNDTFGSCNCGRDRGGFCGLLGGENTELLFFLVVFLLLFTSFGCCRN